MAAIPARMSDNELALFVSFLRNSAKYLEFGVGGTTVLAATHVRDWVIAVDSSKEWIDKVHLSCSGKRLRPEFFHVDIGPVGEWGVPSDPSTRTRWRSYHSDIWNTPKSMTADLFLIDGRFRVACFAQIVLRCEPQAIIGFHDFASRERYYVVREIGREIASTGDMSFFLPLPRSRDRALQVLDRYIQNPS